MELHFLKAFVINFRASAFAIFLPQKLEISSIVGFFMVGMTLGPHGIILYFIGSKENLAKGVALLES